MVADKFHTGTPASGASAAAMLFGSAAASAPSSPGDIPVALGPKDAASGGAAAAAIEAAAPEPESGSVDPVVQIATGVVAAAVNREIAQERCQSTASGAEG